MLAVSGRSPKIRVNDQLLADTPVGGGRENEMRHWLIIGLAATGLLLFGAAGAEIYKSVDKDGNVVYSDEPLSADAKPVTLKQLSVVTTRKPVVTSPASPDPDAEQDLELTEEEARDVRAHFAGFALTRPVPEETYWGTDNAILASVELPNPLLPGYQIVFSVNGNDLAPDVATTTRISGFDRGVHTISAQVVDQRGGTVVSTPVVTFYVKQHSVNFPRSS